MSSMSRDFIPCHILSKIFENLFSSILLVLIERDLIAHFSETLNSLKCSLKDFSKLFRYMT